MAANMAQYPGFDNPYMDPRLRQADMDPQSSYMNQRMRTDPPDIPPDGSWGRSMYNPQTMALYQQQGYTDNLRNQSYPRQRADNINTLPTDDTPPSDAESKIVNTLFKNQSKFEVMFKELKDLVFIGILFYILCLPQVDSIIKGLVAAADRSVYILYLIKTLIFLFVYFIFINWVLCRK